MDRSDMILIGYFSGITALGAASTIVIEKAVTKYGHLFKHFQAEFGLKNVVLLGVIGAVQTIASLLLGAILLTDSLDKVRTPVYISTLLMTHTLSACTLVGLTALAAKTNLIASRLTLFAGIMLVINSFILNLSTLYILRRLI